MDQPELALLLAAISIVADEAQTIVNANYQGNFERLLKIKDEFDPTNLFRLNANIRRST